MSERKPPRDIWSKPPEKPRPVEEELADSPALAGEEEPEGSPEAQEETGYAPRHRAPGRGPLIKRRRSRPEDPEETEGSLEATWAERDEKGRDRWIDKEESIVAPPPRPVEETPYLGPRRTERKRKPTSAEEGPPELIRRTRDYSGRHLAPKKPTAWSRGAEGDVEEFTDRSELDRMEARSDTTRAPRTFVEGDVRDEPDTGLFARPWRTRRNAAPVVPPDEVVPKESAPPDEAAPEESAPQDEAALQDEAVPESYPEELAPAESPPQEEAEAEAPEVQEAEVQEAEVQEAEVQEAEVQEAEVQEAEVQEAEVQEAEVPEAEVPEAEVPEAPGEIPVEKESDDPEATGEEPGGAPEAPEAISEEAPPAPPAPEAASGETSTSETEPASDPAPEAIAAPSDEEASVDSDADGAEATEDEEDDEVPIGPRTAALQQRKKKQKLRKTAGGVLAAVAAVAAVIGVGVLAKNVVDEPRERVAVPLSEQPAEPEGGTTLLFGTREDGGSDRGAIWMTLFSYDAEEDKASVVYIPPHTAVEVPGRGLQGVGEAYGSGGIPLLLVATENLLGVSIDRYVELSDKDARVFFEGLESLTVDVPAEVRVPAGKDQARLIFVDGPQQLTPELLVKLLYIVGIDGDDVELGGRHLAFWDAVFDAYDDPDEVAELIEGAGAALGESDATTDDHAEFFGAIADLPAEKLTLTALPVRPISAGDSQLYATDEDELAEFVAATIGAGRDKPAEVRVQVLNGNGVPGIGQEVADRLVGEGFRVILSGNARRLNYSKTLVIAYDSSAAGVELAERARDLLGVGEVQVSAQQQGIVDLTIVVGKDFLRAR